MLIEIKNYKRKDGTAGAKLIFLDSKDEPLVGYCDAEDAVAYTDQVSESETFDSTRAREYEVSRDVFNDTMTTRVQLS